MIKITNSMQANEITDIPMSVKKVIIDIMECFDEHYGVDRDYINVAGYVLIMMNKNRLLEQMKLDNNLWTSIPEHVDRIRIEGSEDWTNTLILANNDYGISILMPLSITPQNFIDEMT